MQQRAAELEAIITSIADGLVVNEVDGRIVTANPAAQQLLDLSPEHWEIPFHVRWQNRRIYGPDGQPIPLEQFPMLRALRGELVRNQVLRVQIPGRPEVWLSMSSAPIRTPEGQIHGAVTIFADITSFHELQERERRMLYTVAHDLRSPATIINGRVQLILELLAPHATEGLVQESVEALRHALRRMNRMIDDLTQVASLDTAGVPLQRVSVALPSYLPGVIQQNADVIDPARITLHVPHDLPLVSADPARLERILLNLLENAQKCSPPDTPITATAHPHDGEVEIAVTDRGKGIPLRTFRTSSTASTAPNTSASAKASAWACTSPKYWSKPTAGAYGYRAN